MICAYYKVASQISLTHHVFHHTYTHIFSKQVKCKRKKKIFFFLKAQNANTLGESAIAEEASRTAKTLNILGTVFGIIIIIVWITATFM